MLEAMAPRSKKDLLSGSSRTIERWLAFARQVGPAPKELVEHEIDFDAMTDEQTAGDRVDTIETRDEVGPSATALLARCLAPGATYRATVACASVTNVAPAQRDRGPA